MYVVLTTAALIRKLLMDGTALAKVVNQGGPRMKLTFAARPMHQSHFHPNSPPDRLSVHGECLDPALDCQTANPPLRLGIDAWLAHRIGSDLARTDSLNVGGWISHLANRDGGVHVGAPRDEVQRRVF